MIKLVLISDTHGRHGQLTLPPGDILIHSGDCTYNAGRQSLREFLTWFQAQPHTHKIFCAGNHDWAFEKWPDLARQMAKEVAPNCIYLEDDVCEVMGFKVFGSPYSPRFFDWAFNCDRGADIRRHWDMIPENTDILVTHGPAYGRLDKVNRIMDYERDYHQGCHDLKEVIDTKLKTLKIHTFGHLHLQGCQTEVYNGVTYVNAACVDESYQIRGPVQVVEI